MSVGLGLALALVPSPLATADWTIPAASQQQPVPIAVAMQVDPAPPPTVVVQSAPPPPPAVVQPHPPPADQTLSDASVPTINVSAKERHPREDPFEDFNRASYDFSIRIDKAVLRPVALSYRHAVPAPARDGIRNLLSNIGEPLVFVNDLLQFKVGRAVKTLGRFVINSTLGIGGLFDNAKRKPFNLPHHNNSLGDTLGYYGVGPGPYLYLPILGPTTLRDAIAGQAQGMLLPNVSHTPFGLREYQISTGVVGGLDQRAEADDDLRVITQDSVDPYATLRSLVLQDRAGEIAGLKSGALDDLGKDPLAVPAEPGLDDPPLVDPAAPAPPSNQTAPAPAPPPKAL